jgi:hypothetical protein
LDKFWIFFILFFLVRRNISFLKWFKLFILLIIPLIPSLMSSSRYSVQRFTSAAPAARFLARPKLRRWAIASLLSGFGLALGLVPALHPPTATLELGSMAQAQAPGNISLYTQLAREIEAERMRYYADVKQMMGGNVPDDVCGRSNLPGNVRRVCNDFNRRVYSILEGRMEPSEFARLKAYCSRNPKPGQCP